MKTIALLLVLLLTSVARGQVNPAQITQSDLGMILVTSGSFRVQSNNIPSAMFTPTGAVFYVSLTLSNSVYNTNLLAGGSFNLDYSLGNYQYITSGSGVTVNGFVNILPNVVNWTVLSWSNSAATAQTFTWPTPARLGSTNGITTVGATRNISVPASALVKATFSNDPHGTNACVLVYQ